MALAGMAAAGGYLRVMTFYLQDSPGMTPLRGIVPAPAGGRGPGNAPASGRLTARWGARTPLLVSGAAITAGAGLLTGLSGTTSSTLLVG